ncbi:MAG: hypothetical protein AB1422_15805 [bacterium]
MKLNKVALGLAGGIVWGLTVFIATIWVLLISPPPAGGNHLELLGKFYIGYCVNWPGSLIGLAYGFVNGFITLWVCGWLYNKFSKAQ